jgi:predicted DNA-binding mobile mystery protein A
MTSNRNTARARLDERLSSFKPADRFAVPSRGWVRAIRDALGMSAVQLGKRVGVKPQSVGDFEKSEVVGTIQINSLRRIAEALDCTLVYALVPNSSLDETVRSRARAIARADLERIGHSMDLEAQGLSKAEREEQIEKYIHEHLSERDVWERT